MARGDPMLAYAKQYDALKAELQTLGFLCQGSLQTRRVACGKTTCRCHRDPDARHGPYHYWTRKARGKTVGMHLTEDEVVLYQEWIENNRELERIVTEMRDISSRVRPHNRPGGPLNRRVSGSSAAVSARGGPLTLRTPLTVPRLRLPAKKTRPITDFCKRLP